MIKNGIYISHTASDREFVNMIRTDLIYQLGELSISQWELGPGESIMQKLLREGLSLCGYFIIVLSKESVTSKWLKFELDSKLVDNMKEITAIIPLIGEKCHVPYQLKQFQVIDFSKNYGDGINSLLSMLSGKKSDADTRKAGYDPRTVTIGVNRLSPQATMVGFALLSKRNDQLSFERVFSVDDLESIMENLPRNEINDAIEELERFGLVKTMKGPGVGSIAIEPTYALYDHFDGHGLDYSTKKDAVLIASKLLDNKDVMSEELEATCGLPPGRIRRALDYLSEYGVVNVASSLGGDYTVTPNSQTQNFVRNRTIKNESDSGIRQRIYEYVGAELSQLSQIDRRSAEEFRSIIDNLNLEDMSERDVAQQVNSLKQSIIFRMADLGY